jgi:hypothetical protein
MDENTRFLIKRIDESEERLYEKMDKLQERLDELSAFENKVYGMAILAGALGSLMVDFLFKHLT